MEIFTSSTAGPPQASEDTTDAVKVDTSVDVVPEQHVLALHDVSHSEPCDGDAKVDKEQPNTKVDDDARATETITTEDDPSTPNEEKPAKVEIVESDNEPEAKRAKTGDDVKPTKPITTENAAAVPTSPTESNARPSKVDGVESDGQPAPPSLTEDPTSAAPTSSNGPDIKLTSPDSNKNSISWILTSEPAPSASEEIDAAAVAEYEALKERFRVERTPFLQSLSVHDRLDIKCYKYRQWFGGKVLKISDKKVKIHFHGFKKPVDYDRDDFMHLAPEGTYAAPFDSTSGAKWKQAPSAIDADLDGLSYIPDQTKPKPKKAPAPKRPRPTEPRTTGEVIVKSVSRSRATPLPQTDLDGKLIVKKELPPLPPPRPVGSSKRPKPDGHDPIDPFLAKGICRDDMPAWLASTSTVKPTGDFKADLEREQEVCSVCLEVEDPDGSEYVLCDGGCLGAFHQACVGIAPDTKLDEEWRCDSCVRHEHECPICRKLGLVGESLVKCALEDCGKYYHPECLIGHPLTQVGLKHKTLVCPRHTCDNCYAKKGSEGLMKCTYCSMAYHPRCIPPSCRFNDLAMVCGRDKAMKLPSIPSFYGPGAVVFDGKFKFPDIFLPKVCPAATSVDKEEQQVDVHQPFQFRLPATYLDESNAPPPRFQKLRRNQYLFKPLKLDMNDLPMCQCTDVCDDDCTNRASFVECIGNAGNGDKKERHFNCRVGPDCGNRALQVAAIPKTKVFKTTNGRGFGLRVLEPVKAGALVIEYVGEVLTAWMKQDRMIAHAETSPNNPNYYIMELDKNVYLDGRVKGSDSRFINHSCDPNCHLLKWEVGEFKRIAITALRDIEADEELSYDYQMETTSTDSFKCHCGAVKCRGTMAPDNLNKEAHAKLKLEEDNAKKTKKPPHKKRKRSSTKAVAALAVEPPNRNGGGNTSRRHVLAAVDDVSIKAELIADVKSEEGAATTDETRSPLTSTSSSTSSPPDTGSPGPAAAASSNSIRDDNVAGFVDATNIEGGMDTSEEDASPPRPTGDLDMMGTDARKDHVNHIASVLIAATGAPQEARTATSDAVSITTATTTTQATWMIRQDGGDAAAVHVETLPASPLCL
ncbi:hypothetical protein DYB31_003306 [Aphanomyces astaci]|uniref:Histone-lysine N-methyltransferase n=1 Tax=Aphanomyces astaci TaxID=112090 RepID=A0A397F2D7_APHAT|nr:hypothetical protein DYB31_003306 [Aphanomyces astaci]